MKNKGGDADGKDGDIEHDNDDQITLLLWERERFKVCLIRTA